MKDKSILLLFYMSTFGFLHAQFEPLATQSFDPIIHFRAPASYFEMLHDGLSHILYTLESNTSLSIMSRDAVQQELLDTFIALHYAHDAVANRSGKQAFREVDREFLEEMLHKIDNLIELFEDDEEEQPVRSCLLVLHRTLQKKIIPKSSS